MKVRVKEQFKDKYTGKVYKIGDELEMTVQRVNEVIAVGSLIELLEQEKAEQTENAEPPQEQADGQEERADAGEQAAEETPKQTGRRKRTK